MGPTKEGTAGSALAGWDALKAALNVLTVDCRMARALYVRCGFGMLGAIPWVGCPPSSRCCPSHAWMAMCLYD